MTSTHIETSLPYSWLKQIPHEIKELDQIPLWGSPPPFPWQNFAEALSKSLQIPSLTLTPIETKWRSQHELIEGLGENPILHAFRVSPLEGSAFFIIPREELKTILSLAVPSSQELSLLEEDDYLKEFYDFLSIEAIRAFEKIKYDPSLTLQLLKEAKTPDGSCLAIDVDIGTPLKTFRGRLLLTQEMRQSLQKKYTPTTLAYPRGMSEAVKITVELIAGSVILSRDEWSSVNPGDFIVLDSCSLVPGEDKGRIVLMAGSLPLFRGKLKDGHIKILEYPQLQEVKALMVKHQDEEFEDEFESEEEHSTEEHSTFEEEEISEGYQETEETNHGQSLSEHTEESDIEEKEHTKEETISDHETPTKAEIHKPSEVAAPALSKPEDIPLSIVIEVGRIQMSIKQLMQLAPGNLLEIDVKPENGVDLVINGACVAKGELLKIGDTLGVRILDKA